MSAPIRKRGFLLNLAAEGMAPAVPGCAAPPPGEKAIVRFGLHIVGRWLDWMQDQSPALCHAGISELADLPAAKARLEATAAIDHFAPQASVEDRNRAVEYLCALPRCAQRALVLDQATGGFTLPAGAAPDSFLPLLGLLPIDAPPYAPGSPLPDTSYSLGEFAGTGSLGTFYRATSPDYDAPLLIKCCTDPALTALLRQQADRLTPPVSADRWSDRVVRLLGFDLEHPTPYLVFEQVPGGDLAMLLSNLKHQTGHGLAPDKVFRLIEQIAEGLAFAHALGLVHGDVKPANILISGDTLKLADLGAGLATADHAIIHSQIGSKPHDQLGPADQAGLLRGTASLLYLSPEQRRGDSPDPRHDLHSLGVLWYQLLAGDIGKAPGSGWAVELAENYRVPKEQIALIERCIAPLSERPRDAGALLALMRPQEPAAPVRVLVPDSVVPPEEVRRERLRKQNLLRELKELRGEIEAFREARERANRYSAGDILLLLLLPVSFVLGYLLIQNVWLALAVCLLAAVPSWWIRRQSRRTRFTAFLVSMKGRVERLGHEHPDEIQSWGGQEKLLNPDLLAEVLAAFEQDWRMLPETEAKD
jgi:serine/threonine protein kinase